MVIVPAHRAGDPGSNPCPGEYFSLKLLKDENFNHMSNLITTFDDLHLYTLKPTCQPFTIIL